MTFFLWAYDLQLLRLSLYFEKSSTWFFFLTLPTPPINTVSLFTSDEGTSMDWTRHYVQTRRGVDVYPASLLTVP